MTDRHSTPHLARDGVCICECDDCTAWGAVATRCTCTDCDAEACGLHREERR